MPALDDARPAAGAAATSPRSRAGSCSSPGPTGSGKSTTLAAMIDLINEERHEHIMTDRGPDRVPPPAQELHRQPARARAPTPRASRSALKAALRQDPDVILVGEMRDLETISTALTAAETGHLVFATLHTQDTAQTVDRIVDVVPAGAAAAGARAALGRAPGHRHPAAPADGRRRGPRLRLRGARPDAGGPQPDPRGQDPPDLLGAPDRRPHGMQTMDAALADLVRQRQDHAASWPRRRSSHARRSCGRLHGRTVQAAVSG